MDREESDEVRKEEKVKKWINIVYVFYIKPALVLTTMLKFLFQGIEIFLRGFHQFVSIIFTWLVKAIARKTPYLRVIMFFWDISIATVLWGMMVIMFWSWINPMF